MNGASLRRDAIAILERNWTGAGTLPSPYQYPHQWSWDSAFIAVGWSRVDPGRGRTELISLFEGQWACGRVPHIKFDPDLHEDAYFPGPRFWNSAAHPDAPERATSGIVQPPLHARAAWQIYEADPTSRDTARFLNDVYPKLVAWHAYLLQRRNLGGTALVSIVHPWESGLDNSPMWDAPLNRLDDGHSSEFVRRDTINVDASQRPSDRDYERYVALAAQYRDVAYDDSRLAQHGFVVEDPLFNAVLLDGERCLSRIADVIGAGGKRHEETARALSEAMNASLWDDEHGWFCGRDVIADSRLSDLTVSSLVPLLDPWLPRDRRERIIDVARSDAFAGGCAYPLPSVAIDSPSFDRRRYWRGPMWANTNWLVYLGARVADELSLARLVAEATLEAVSREGFREYFDPMSGEGLGAHEFSWTAALAIDWLIALETPPLSLPIVREAT